MIAFDFPQLRHNVHNQGREANWLVIQDCWLKLLVCILASRSVRDESLAGQVNWNKSCRPVAGLAGCVDL
jgi:hypothetical protein